MADGGSSCNSSGTEDDFELSVSTSLSSEASEEMLLTSLPLEMEVLPYRFEPDLLATIDCNMDNRARCTAVSESLIVDCVGNTDW